MKIHKGKVVILGVVILVVFITLNLMLKDTESFGFILGTPPELRFGYNTRILDQNKAKQTASPDYAKDQCSKSAGFVWNEKTKTCDEIPKTSTTPQTATTSENTCIKNGGYIDYKTKECVFGAKSSEQPPIVGSTDPLKDLYKFVTQTPDPTPTSARCAVLAQTKITAIEYADVDNDGDMEEVFKIQPVTDRSAPFPAGVLALTSPLTANTGEQFYDVQFYIQCIKSTNLKLFTNSASDMYITVQAQNSKQNLLTVASGKCNIGSSAEIPHNTLTKLCTVRIDAKEIEKNLDNGLYDSVIHFFVHGKMVVNFEGFATPDKIYQIDIPMTKQGVVNYHKVRVDKQLPTEIDCKLPLVLQDGKCVQQLGQEPPPEQDEGIATPLECFDVTFTSEEFNDCLYQKKFVGIYTIGFASLIAMGLMFRKPRQIMVSSQGGYA